MSFPIFSIREGNLNIGNKELFHNLNIHIYQGEKACLVGRNGEGKSTLLKLIYGNLELDSGERWLLPSLEIGYLPQQTQFNKDDTVLEFVSLGLKEKSESTAYLIDIILKPLALSPDQKMRTLSGGQARRASLAQTLIEDRDILLLDEPTNHLDIHTIEWLEEYIRNYKGAVLCISHDRTFLKNISTKTFWLDRGSMKVLDKGYAHFDDWYLNCLEIEQKELERLSKKLSEEETWKIQGVTARRKRNQNRLQKLYSLREKLRNDKAHLAKTKGAIKLDPLAPQLASKLVFELDDVSYKIENNNILSNFSTRISKGDKIGIVGNNGTGKSTFLKLLTGNLQPDSGRIKIGKTLNITYFDQARSELNPDDTLWETLCAKGADYIQVGESQMHVVAYLKNFLFDPKQARDKVSTLSGGQANRLLLAKALANPGSVLILDEPTNDLDMDTLDMIQEILSDYEGTLILVSHDRDFIDRIVTKTYAFSGNGIIEEVIGGYSDYLNTKQLAPLKENIKAKVKPKQIIIEETSIKTKSKSSYIIQRELEMLPKEIENLENEIHDLEIRLSENDLYSNNTDLFSKLSNELTNKKNELNKKWLRWQELENINQ
jgi:ATP-binding cassette subfamily F protein uup